jgi:hypothetical protein
MKKFRYLLCKDYESKTAITSCEGDNKRFYLEPAKKIADLIYESNPQLKDSKSIEIIVQIK